MKRDSESGHSSSARWRRLLPPGVICCAILIAVASSNSVSVFPLLAAAPVVAAPLLSLAGTIATGAAVMLAGLLLVTVYGGPYDITHNVALTSMILLTALAAGINRIIAHDRRQLKTAREVAETVQRAVLPTPPDHIGPLLVAARYQAAEREAAIGGDLYAVQEGPYGARLMLADVRGHGVGAVRIVNGLLGAFFEAAIRVPELPRVVDQLEQKMRRMNADLGGPRGAETFATAVIAEIPPDCCTVRMANLGHPPPLLVEGGRVRCLEPGSPSLPLGLADLSVPNAPEIPVDRFDLPAGATLLLFTDGLTEARDPRGAFYDPAPVLSRPAPPGPGGLLSALVADLRRYTGGRQEDDIALLALTRTAEPDRPPERAATEPDARS
ncbi:PP2C family protein-serine/threonine phosphatase [Streptomyces sp. TP-A0874]|uniref:PP2C family protein-serine/threonine phosphatase n=1 Tax=Streptomyces sp. TP-A0874 TaxID=549819 RepID=UPI000852F87E|nr:PP2C family protein-serine/threonine phosphatase [Streptomyces sp. TP-A0874]